MRRALVTALAVPVLLLSACGSDEPEVEDVPTTTEDSTPAEETTTDDAAAETTTDDTAVETTTDDTAVETTTDDAAVETTTDDTATETDDGGEAASGDGQAAADRTKEWLVAFVNGEESVCDMMLDLSSEGPMKDSETDYQLCLTTFPSMASEMFDAEMAGIIESMEITGAEVTGDTAIVGKDNFSDMFSASMGDQVITLKMIDGEWFVDMNESFN